jgi:crossover junction endodeoxyribonuclease RuvC
VAGSSDVPVFAYPPATVKKAVVGYGGANKEQIQRMVQVLLSLGNQPKPDEADAMAIAICHALSKAP